MTHTSYEAAIFSSLDDLTFSADAYSRMKFGDDGVAKAFGTHLAEKFYADHGATLLSNRCLVIPSPYNFVPNAATIMTGHFVNRLNELLVEANGDHVEYATIPRKVSYINDYGFLPKEQRRALIDNDEFYIPRAYFEGRLLIFIDDVKITGTHEDKLVEMLAKHGLTNDAFFLYYGRYTGNDPAIESKINFAAVNNLEQYGKIIDKPGNHLIVRPIKYLLSQELDAFRLFISRRSHQFRAKLFHACLNEGYYKIPSYQANFQALRELATAWP